MDPQVRYSSVWAGVSGWMWESDWVGGWVCKGVWVAGLWSCMYVYVCVSCTLSLFLLSGCLFDWLCARVSPCVLVYRLYNICFSVYLCWCLSISVLLLVTFLSLCVVFQCSGLWGYSLFESVCCVSVLWSVRVQFVWVCVLCFSALVCEVTVCLSLCVVFQCSGLWGYNLFESVYCVSVLWSVRVQFVWVCVLCFSALVCEGTVSLSLCVVFQCSGLWRSSLFESLCCVSVLWSVRVQFVWVCVLCFSALVCEGTVCLSLCVVFQCSGLWGYSLFESVCCVSVLWSVFQRSGLCFSALVCVSVLWSVRVQFVRVCVLCFSTLVCEGTVCLSLCVVFQCSGLCFSALVCVSVLWSVFQCSGLWGYSLFESVCCVSVLWSVFQCSGLCFSALVCVSVLWSVRVQFVWACVLCFSTLVCEGAVWPGGGRGAGGVAGWGARGVRVRGATVAPRPLWSEGEEDGRDGVIAPPPGRHGGRHTVWAALSRSVVWQTEN